MVLYVIKRVIGIFAILAAMSVLIFGITQVLPGDVASVLGGQFADEATLKAIEQRLGLDAPIYVQYWRWASQILVGNLGTSIVMERAVGPMIWEAFLSSALLAGIAFIFVTIFGLSLGVIAAIRQDKPADHAISLFSYIGISVPEFFWAIVGIIVFARYLGWLPSGGSGNISDGFFTWASYLVLPVATLTFTLIAHVSRLTRSSMIETLRSQYVRNARAKGLPESVVIKRHAMRNALLPAITVLAVDVGWLLGNIVVVEAVFSYPGIGRLLLFAIERHDLPLIQAGILLIAAVYCFANLAADLLYAYFNPKIRYGSAH